MFKKICKSVTPIMLLAAAPVMAQEVPQTTYNCDFDPACEVAPGIYGKMSSPVTSKFNMSIGGFVKLDYAYNSVNMGPGNGIPAMGTVQQIPKSSSPAALQDQSIFTARQSRIWFKVAGPTFLGAKTSGLLEVDFYGGNSSGNDRGNVRMRLANGQLDWKNTQVVFGQAYDIFGPAVPSTIDFGTNGATGAPSQPRVPQIRVAHRFDLGAGNALQVIAGIQDPTQNHTAGAGTFGDTPNVAGQVMMTSKVMGVAPGYYGLPMKPLTLGLFGLYGKQDVVTESSTIDSWGYGAYTFVPVVKSADGKGRTMTVSLEGQAYMAQNMGFNGATANPLQGAVGDRNGAKGFGYYGQVIFYPTQQLGLTAGYSGRNAYNNDQFTTANYERSNTSGYANVAYDLNAAIRVAAEYQHLKTKYGNNTAGTSDQGINNVARAAFYYFF